MTKPQAGIEDTDKDDLTERISRVLGGADVDLSFSSGMRIWTIEAKGPFGEIFTFGDPNEPVVTLLRVALAAGDARLLAYEIALEASTKRERELLDKARSAAPR